MKFGLSESEYQFINKLVVEPLKRSGATVWCFGSRARGDNGRFSDLDLMVESKSDISVLLSNIREQVTNSNFPYIVDLVCLEDFASSYLENFEKEKIKF